MLHTIAHYHSLRNLWLRWNFLYLSVTKMECSLGLLRECVPFTCTRLSIMCDYSLQVIACYSLWVKGAPSLRQRGNGCHLSPGKQRYSVSSKAPASQLVDVCSRTYTPSSPQHCVPDFPEGFPPLRRLLGFLFLWSRIPTVLASTSDSHHGVEINAQSKIILQLQLFVTIRVVVINIIGLFFH